MYQEITTFVFDFLKGNLPCVFDDYYQHRLPLETMQNEHSRFRLIISSYRTTIGEHTVKLQGAKMFNAFTSNINLSVRTKTFKNSIKKKILPYTTG